MNSLCWIEIKKTRSEFQFFLLRIVAFCLFCGCGSASSISKSRTEDRRFAEEISSFKMLNYKDGFSLYLPFASSQMLDILPNANDKYREIVIEDGKLINKLDVFKNLLSLECLRINNSKVSDLSPLKNLKLKVLVIKNSSVTDLSPLNSISTLEVLDVSQSKVSSLQTIQKLSLKTLVISNTQVSDLSPITNMPLAYLDLHNTPVMDISPLKSLPLQAITFSENRVKNGLDVLNDIRVLQRINGKAPMNGQSSVETRLIKASSNMSEAVFVDMKDQTTQWIYYGRQLEKVELISEIQRICEKTPRQYAVYGTVPDLIIGALCKTMNTLQDADVKHVALLNKMKGVLLRKEEVKENSTRYGADYLRLQFSDNNPKWFYRGKYIGLDELRSELMRETGRHDLIYLISNGGNEQLPLMHLIDLLDVLYESGVRKINLWDVFEGELVGKEDRI